MSTSSVSLYPTWGQRLGVTTGWLLMAVVFGAVGWFLAIKPLATALGNWNLARDYQPVEATVIERTGRDDGGSFTFYAARYDVAGKTYETERLTVLDDETIDEPSNEAVLGTLAKARGEQKTATIWVSPRRPDVAVVSRDLPVKSLWARGAQAVIFSIFALGGALGAIGALANFPYYRRMHDAAGLWIFGSLWCGFIFPILTLVSNARTVEWIPLLFVGLFALIGALFAYGAVSASIWGSRDGSSLASLGSPSKKLDKAALATSWGKKGKPVKGNVKRGGMGGRGADFDKD